jgi:hypothetical protein
MTEQDIAKLRAAGFTDADIEDYKANEVQAPTASGGPAVPDTSLPEVDVNQPSETLRNAQAAGAPTTNPGSWTTDAAGVATLAAPYVIPTVATGAGLYGVAKVGGWGRNLVNTVGEGVKAMNTQTMASQHAAEGVADRALVNQGVMTAEEALARQQAREAAMNAQRGVKQVAQTTGQVAQNVRPAVPTGAPATGPVAQTTGQVAQNVRPAVPTGAPATGPVAPPMGAAANEASMTNSVRQAAASRISNLMPKATEALGSVGRAVSPALGAAGRFLSAANPYLTAAQGLTYSKDLGPQVPTSGPLRGSEINPRTGKGWTAQELAAYKQQYGG